MENERGITITKTINEKSILTNLIITNPYQNLDPIISNNKITRKTNKTPKKIKRKQII